ncbi:MAG: hypothetical protein WKG07_27125 [Hymenobacter sp.]
MQADLTAIENPKDRLSIRAGLAEFITPKLARTSLAAEGGVRLTAIQIVDFDGSPLSDTDWG